MLAAHEKIPEAEEGLGLLALREQRTDDAHNYFESAVEANSTSARCYIEYAKLEPDRDKAEDALLKAAGINPKLAEPFALMAARDTDPRKRLMHWKAATERDPRNTAYWKSLAETYLDDNNYGEAGKAWRSGEQAATDPVRAREVSPRAHARGAAAPRSRRGREAPGSRREGARARETRRPRRSPNCTRPKPNSATERRSAATSPCPGGTGPSPTAKSAAP